MNESSRMPVIPYTVFLRRYGQKVAEFFAENVRIFLETLSIFAPRKTNAFMGSISMKIRLGLVHRMCQRFKIGA
ncbi:MAG: hypothetical protein M3Q07_23440 [Pseudobdellovibrionaceae bacterium]|nr:hypothetical protein [Pseudobdellovibrionaceae bacterium]